MLPQLHLSTRWVMFRRDSGSLAGAFFGARQCRDSAERKTRWRGAVGHGEAAEGTRGYLPPQWSPGKSEAHNFLEGST